MLALSVFMPSIQDWATQGGTAWYRPYALSLLVIAFVYWGQQQRHKKRRKLHQEQDSTSNDA